MKRWLLLLPAVLFGCPQFAPDDVCGYPGFCDGGSNESGIDAPPGCDLTKDPKDSPACVDSSVGIFVDATKSDANSGTKENPVATITAGISLAKNKGLPRIYVCDGTYTEDLLIDAAHDGLSIYGGWKCTDWSYSGNKAQVGKTNTAAKIDSLTAGILFEDLSISAVDGPNPGDSSIALFVNNSQSVVLTRLTLTAGSGTKGADGTPTTYTFDGGLDGHNADGIDGGAATMVTCPAGDTTVGGKGGDVPGNRNGDNGLPAHDGGVGGTGSTNNCITGTGGPGASGFDGDAGSGAVANGTLSPNWTPAPGSTGAPGGAGQGGGGGGANFVSVAQQGGGGSGGAGGCGGAGGGPGKGGGASIGLLVATSTVTLKATTITTNNAGNGGAGAVGQSGQGPGGLQGAGVIPGCGGGSGGAGGAGGAGGGGAGGLSVGVFYKGTPPMLDSVTTNAIKVGTKGSGGIGQAANVGIDGQAQAILECKSPICN